MKALAKAKSMGKFARYSDGSEDGVQSSDAEGPASSYASANEVRAVKSDSDSAPAKSTDFKSAFAAARKSGASTFEWNGKKYTTELAKSAAPSVRSASSGVDFKRESAKLNAAGKGDYTPPQRSILDNPAAARALVDRGLRVAEGERAVKAYKAQKLANGGVVQRATAKIHGKAC